MNDSLAALRALALAISLGSSMLVATRAAEPAHVHGVVQLNAAIEAGVVTLQIEAPLDSLVGFEHAPRTAAQKQAAQAMLDRFNAPQSLFGLPAAAQCSLRTHSAESEALKSDAAKPSTGAEEHADLDGSFVFECKQAGAIDSIDLGGLLAAFPRIVRVEAVVVAPGVQVKRVVTRPDKTLRWGR